MRTLLRRNVPLEPMTPLEQLRAGRTGRRLVQLVVGLVLFGVAMGMLVRAHLGLEPWGVFHDGLRRLTGLSFGTIIILTSVAVLLLWIPLRQWPGLGTIANAVIVGLATDATLAVLDDAEGLAAGWALLIGGIVVNGFGGALYIGSQYGAGPRDGLMTGLAQRTGRSIRLVRTLLEITVLALGWLLGGVVGVGTVLYALLIGPVIQAFLPMVTVDLSGRAREGGAAPEPAPGLAACATDPAP